METRYLDLIAQLREQCPDDDSLARLQEEQDRVTALLRAQEYAALPATQELLALFRKEIVATYKSLAFDQSLTEPQRFRYWGFIDGRKAVLARFAKDFTAEIAQIERELEAELER